MSGHTPGPWCTAPVDGVYHGDNTTKYHAVKKFWPGPGAYERIADCTDSAYPEANARLIAAAPDLLEALLKVRTDLLRIDFATEADRLVYMQKYVRAALSKAGL